jgi:hypothetical protein
VALATASAGLLSLVLGCETAVHTDDGRRMPPEPRAGPDTPENAPVNAIAMVLGPKPIDTNGNRRPDMIQLEAYLFARPFPAPRWRDGSFEFAVYQSGTVASPVNPGVPALRTWVVPTETLQQLRTRSLVGEGYAIGLSFLDEGVGDQIDADSIDLLAKFVPADGGSPVFLNGVRTVSMVSAASR